MLKIKDNVDLKELEKFGFEVIETLNFKTDIMWKNGYNIGVYAHPNYYKYKEITWNRQLSRNTVDTLYDLIKADLIEKVSD